MDSAHSVAVIGLGRMGLSLCENLHDHNYKVFGFDLSEKARNQLSSLKMIASVSIAELCCAVATPRHIILLVPEGAAVDEVLLCLLPHLSPGDIIIDAGNSYYEDSVRRKRSLDSHNVGFIDVGISGGLQGARNGACLTIGGDKKIFQRVEYLFRDIARPNGYMHVGPTGWGHLVKTVHNGIEYAFLQSIAEGLNIVKVVSEKEGVQVDLAELCEVWNNGSIIESRLMADAVNALKFIRNNPDIRGSIAGGQTGLWAQEIASRHNISVPALDAALAYRKKSQSQPDYIGKVITAIRYLFGGHSFN